MWNYRVLSVWGIPIRVNVSLLVFLPVLAWLIGSGQQIELYAGIIDSFAPKPLDVAALTAGNTPWVVGGAAAVGLFVSVTLHELGHAWMAMRYDIEIESITLWIFGGLAALSRIPREWNREFWIAVAGPFVSVLTAVACYLLVLALPAGVPVEVVFVLGWLAITNVSLTVFNMIPAFPMDGGRVLRAVLARNRPYASATRTAARVGVWFAVVFAVVGVFSNPMLILLALFVYGAAKSESRVTILGELLTGFRAGDLTDRDVPHIDADATVEEFVERMLGSRRTTFVVTEAGEPVGVVTLGDLQSVRERDRDSTTVGELAHREVGRVDAVTPAFDALVLFGRGGARYLLVEEAGDVVGLLSEERIGDVIALQKDGLEGKGNAEPFRRRRPGGGDSPADHNLFVFLLRHVPGGRHDEKADQVRDQVPAQTAQGRRRVRPGTAARLTPPAPRFLRAAVRARAGR